ncbi:MAG: ribosome biogenesis GTP-binding protein YsxC [Elusimicrobia bacterium]|nr:ribosome biogenesis GTP-binding protein YsxC [Elusimicrobiota bacterium]
MSTVRPEELGPCGAEVAFVGRSNVGKSSLINKLCNRALAKVSNTPGRTRVINVFLAGHDRWLVDLPGYGYVAGKPPEAGLWEAMIEGYLTSRPTLRMVFALVDAKVGPTKLDFQMFKWLASHDLPWRIVATKADQVKPSKTVLQKREVAQALGVQPKDLAWVSVHDGTGMRELRAETEALLTA